MYVAMVDSRILRSDEVMNMRQAYYEKFGEHFIYFNYADFQRDGDKCAAQVYKETLQKALKNNKPYHIVSHRYDTIDH